MPAYHSVFLDTDSSQLIGSFPLNPLRTRTRGPAITLPLLTEDLTEVPIDHESYDPIDEILAYYRANVFFRNFEVKGPADRILVYGILYVSHLLALIKPSMNKKEGEKALLSSSLDLNFALPGESAFPFHNPDLPASNRDAETLRMYLAQVRQEIAARLLQRMYQDGDNAPSKWWLSFTKRKFMNKSI